MQMPEVHFLTVGEGDCSIIRHASARVTVIDIFGGNRTRATETEKRSAILTEVAKAAAGNPLGNYRMCEKPSHPLDYLDDRGLSPIWRFISTHPDMDHLDGFEALTDRYRVENFWHTGVSRPKPTFHNQWKYREEDWNRYEEVRAGSFSGVKSLKKLAGEKFEFANKGGDNGNGDCLHIAAPDQSLVESTEECENWNCSSYIIVYRMEGGKVVICGDAEDDSFQSAINKYPDLMADVGLLLAPHHGRDSGRDYAFLDHLKPRFTLLGCAPHEHHRTQSWSSRNLPYCKQNQCGNMIAVPSSQSGRIDLYIQSKSFADNSGGDTSKEIYEGMYFYRTV
jgi:beta-lactamase superfamily II metal-dependent hydrolase